MVVTKPERSLDDLTVSEASFVSHRTVDTLRRAMRTGKLPHTWVKGMRLIAPDDLQRWMETGGGTGGDAA